MLKQNVAATIVKVTESEPALSHRWPAGHGSTATVSAADWSLLIVSMRTINRLCIPVKYLFICRIPDYTYTYQYNNKLCVCTYCTHTILFAFSQFKFYSVILLMERQNEHCRIQYCLVKTVLLFTVHILGICPKCTLAPLIIQQIIKG